MAYSHHQPQGIACLDGPQDSRRLHHDGLAGRRRFQGAHVHPVGLECGLGHPHEGGPTLTSPCAGSLQGSGSLVYLRPPASCSRRPAPPRPRGRPDPRRRREGCDVLVAERPGEHFVRLWVDPESGCREMRGSVSSNISCSFGERESFSTAWTSVIRSCRVWPSRRSTASVTSRPALAPPGPGPVRW